MNNLEELHQKIVREIDEERKKDIADFLSAKRQANESAARKEAEALKQFKAMKFDIRKFNAFHSILGSDNETALEKIRKKYVTDESEQKKVSPEHFRALALRAALLPNATRDLPPAYAAVYSTKDVQDKLSGGTGTEVFNYNIINAWDWASGAGNGWFGSGAGSYQVWAEWGFWYRPEMNKYYSIIPHNVFRGFYIVRADDGFWTSKYARVVVSIWTNVWQYNWKGWTNVNVLDIGNDNINVNQRFDTDRDTYYSALLGGGDWAYIRNVVGLYVYARGSGSYSELNFAVGAANYLAAPHVHIY